MESTVPPGIVLPDEPAAPAKRRATVSLVLCLIFFAVLGGFLYKVLHGESVNIKKSANQFDAALVANDASAAPSGGAKYVPKIHYRYGRISSARIVHRENVCGSCGSGTSGSGSSHWNVDILIQSHRGPAVLRIEYGGASTKIDDVIEFGPGDIPGKDHLSKAQKDTIAAAYVKRRINCLRQAGDDVFARDDCTRDDFDFVSSHRRDTSSPKAPTALPKAGDDPTIRCLKKAHRNVKKLQRCAELH